MAPLFPQSLITERWSQEFRESSDDNRKDDPNYWVSNPQTLISSCHPVRFSVGTGHQLLTSIFSQCECTEQELIIVTCFWAKSSSQEAIASLLLKLSKKAISQNRTIRVRICFSSLSIWQKISQTSNIDGKIHPSTTWTKLGLPPASDLKGLQLVIKSVFVRPFSVMHPKFILMDRKLAFMPSCNVSWENWFEGSIEMTGDNVGKLFDFWDAFWGRGGASLPVLGDYRRGGEAHPATLALPAENSIAQFDFQLSNSPASTVLLPSPHHLNPKFSFSSSAPPKTPLNVFLLQALAAARNNVYIQTPNLTCIPVISAILDAISRGINVKIVTSSCLMILEQLVTAGTITEWEAWKLQRRYNSLLEKYQTTLKNGHNDPENLMEKPGVLSIGHYRPNGNGGIEEPVKSHLKCTIIDDEVVILGSGNMDRASWYTSQELGMAFFSAEIAKQIRNVIVKGLEGRVR